MSYSIKPVLHNHIGKDGEQKINIQVIYNRMKSYAPTQFKIKAPKNPVSDIKEIIPKKYSLNISEQSNRIEKRLLDAISIKPIITKTELDLLVKDKQPKQTVIIADFMRDLSDTLKGKLSTGRLSHYITVADKLNEFDPKATFGSVNNKWLQSFEAWLRKQEGRNGKLDVNTIQANMSLLKSVLNKASVEKLVKKEQYQDYKAPAYEQKLPVYLTETEMNKIFDFLSTIERDSYKLAGYYFLLSCNTGYRISDAKKFDYEEKVSEGSIILRAKKNGEIVSIPIHSRLATVLDYIKERPLTLSEQKVRDYVKEICSFVGIKKHIKYHCSRHSWGMLLTKKGFTIEEVAETLGDSVEVARIYARICNIELSKKIMDRLG